MYNYYIDSHCHLETKYYDDPLQVIKEAEDLLVKEFVNISCAKDTFEEAIEFSKKNKNVYLAAGLHPSEADQNYSGFIEKLEKSINNKEINAVGEIGLDYHAEVPKDLQIKMFIDMLELAKRKNMPVVIHSRDATEDMVNILKKYNVKGIVHCFSGSLEIAKEYIKLGYKIGIGGIVTFKNTKLRETLKDISINDIVLETDSPYLAPTPYRGQENYPKYIPIIALEISKVYDLPVDEVMNITTANVYESLGIKK